MTGEREDGNRIVPVDQVLDDFKAGRCVIIVLMFAGRIGPLTLLIALAGRESAARYDYPAENVIMG